MIGQSGSFRMSLLTAMPLAMMLLEVVGKNGPVVEHWASWVITRTYCKSSRKLYYESIISEVSFTQCLKSLNQWPATGYNNAFWIRNNTCHKYQGKNVVLNLFVDFFFHQLSVLLPEFHFKTFLLKYKPETSPYHLFIDVRAEVKHIHTRVSELVGKQCGGGGNLRLSFHQCPKSSVVKLVIGIIQVVSMQTVQKYHNV